MEFMNGVPEIVSEIIFLLSGYLHHRTDTMSYDTYRELMLGQIEDRNVASTVQQANYAKDGWKEDAKGIDENIEMLAKFTKEFRHDRDAKGTPYELVTARMRVLRKLVEQGIPLMPADQDFYNNQDH